MSFDLTPEAAQRARDEFSRALEGSITASNVWQLKLFGEDEEDYIRKEVERKLYEPELPNGGDRERRIVERLKRLSRQKDLVMSDHDRIQFALKKWSKVLPEDPRNAGWYYIRVRMKRNQNKEEYDALIDLRRGAMVDKQWEKKWFYDLILEGHPEPVANFDLECLFLLKKSDDTVTRLIRLRNVVGETTGMINMDAEAFHAPQKFRKFCLEQGNFNWGAGEKEIQKLHNDISRLSAWRVVNEVVTMGWLPITARVNPLKTEADGIWFYGDCARANAGEHEDWLKADADGIYWHRREVDGDVVEEGYQLSDEGREAAFCQKRPRLHPEIKIIDVPLVLSPWDDVNFAGQNGVYDKDKDLITGQDVEWELLRNFFRELNTRLRRNVGSADASFLIGSFLSYAAAPELFARFSLFPGLWVHGEAESGKSTICEWLMEAWGFSLQNGLMLRGKSVSAIGLLQAADQYSNLPAWGDEFRNGEVEDDKLSVLHNGFNRAGQFKFNPSRVQRVMRTNFIVSGESTSNDAAMRGRFPHVQISARQRQGTPDEQRENFQWFNTHRKFFFFFGRFLMDRRREFVDRVFKNLESWSKEDINPRLKIVHGVGFASWMAMVEMLQSHLPDEVKEFRTHMVDHSKAAAADVQSELNVNLFVQDMITAYLAGQIPHHCFRVESDYVNHPPDAPGQVGWDACKLYINPDSTISAMAIYLAKARASVPLKRKDLRDQLSKNVYWIKSPAGKGVINKRFGRPGEKAVVPAWGIDVDLHPLGYQKCTDDEFNDFLSHPKDGDPRKGPLYALVEDVRQKQRAEEREAANEPTMPEEGR